MKNGHSNSEELTFKRNNIMIAFQTVYLFPVYGNKKIEICQINRHGVLENKLK